MRRSRSALNGSYWKVHSIRRTVEMSALSCKSVSECSIGSSCPEQTFAVVDLNDRLWSEADRQLARPSSGSSRLFFCIPKPETRSGWDGVFSPSYLGGLGFCFSLGAAGAASQLYNLSGFRTTMRHYSAVRGLHFVSMV